MSNNRNNEGQWFKTYRYGKDSQLISHKENNKTPYENMTELKIAEISKVKAEPLYNQNLVDVDYITGGASGTVAWPGGQVNINKSGKVGGAEAIHGLFEAPMPGQQVLIGYPDGSSQNPVVIQKYPYYASASQDPTSKSDHELPLTNKNHGATDNILGHFTGSYIALRGTLPLPGEIDIFSPSAIVVDTQSFQLTAETDILIESKDTLDILSTGVMIINSSDTLDILSTDTLTLTSSTGDVDITSTTSGVNINAVPSVIVNSGARPVAAMGDLTPTIFGASPINATGTVLKVI